MMSWTDLSWTILSWTNNIEEYDLSKASQNGWIYFEILRGCYGLPQSGRLANNLLHTCLEKVGYYDAVTTSGLWCHKWRLIQFVLLVDDFGTKYVGKEHALHLLKTPEVDYEITTDWEGTKSAVITSLGIIMPGTPIRPAAFL